MDKETKIQLKYALKYATIIYLISITIIIGISILSSIISRNQIQAALFEIVANILAILTFIYFSHRALDKLYKTSKIFNHLFCYLILIFFLLISGTVTFIVGYTQAGNFSLKLILDSYLGKGIGLVLLWAPIFISSRYQTKHKIVIQVKAIKPIKFFKLDFPIFLLSLILVIILTFVFLSINRYLPTFKNDGTLSALFLAIGVLIVILISYFISCLIFFLYGKIKKKFN